jgi:fibronectin type 3 domain-containing protein
VVRTVTTAGSVVAESAAAAPDPKCQTPIDTYPPPAPTGLKAVPDVGQVSLIWDAVDAPDLAGYIVLRREVGSEKMQPLTPELITGTNYDDKTTRAGVQYEYAVIAVDQAKPPNRSLESPHQIVTARSPGPRHKER